MKRAFITSVSEGYMFALSATMNATRFFGTEAEWHIIHTPTMPRAYLEALAKHFKVVLVPFGKFGPGFNNPKYGYAASLADQYDSICLIDSDLFICANVDEYFAKAEQGFLISAGHMHSGGNLNYLRFDAPETITDRSHAQLADFPVFVRPGLHRDFLEYWHAFTGDEMAGEAYHPLVVMNRSVAKHFNKNQVIALNGERWVADMYYWESTYSVKDRMLFDEHGRIYAIHHKWWKQGRANGEFLAAEQQRNHQGDQDAYNKHLDNAENNFNTVVDLMSDFDNMTPETAWPLPLSGRINWRKFAEYWYASPEYRAEQAILKRKAAH